MADWPHKAPMQKVPRLGMAGVKGPPRTTGQDQGMEARRQRTRQIGDQTWRASGDSWQVRLLSPGWGGATGVWARKGCSSLLTYRHSPRWAPDQSGSATGTACTPCLVSLEASQCWQCRSSPALHAHTCPEIVAAG